MTTNKYFNRLHRTSEQDLFEDMVIESIQQAGVDIWYIPRENLEIDPILGEPTQSSFKEAFQIEAYLPEGGQMDGEQNLMSKFGFRMNQTVDMIISKRRWAEIGTTFPRPREGDLIYIGDAQNSYSSFINTFFEINQVWYTNPDWQFGRHFTYKLMCEAFTYSYEKFQTGVTTIDDMQLPNMDIVDLAINEALGQQKPTVVIDKKNPFGDF